MGTADEFKRQAAHAAADLAEDGMALGLGTGSTAAHAVRRLGERVRQGLRVTGVPTSEATARLAREVGISLTSLDETPALDLTIDGADEVDPQLRLIKGGGGALLREKIVAAASRRMVVIADASKQVETLGRFPLPIEIVRFGEGATRIAVERALSFCGCSGEITRRDSADGAYVTDEGHHILDAELGRIDDPERVAAHLAAVPGVVEHGLFIGLATSAIIAGSHRVEEIGPGLVS